MSNPVSNPPLQYCQYPSFASKCDISAERKSFEKWYTENAFDLERNPIGSYECGASWKAWLGRAAQEKEQE